MRNINEKQLYKMECCAVDLVQNKRACQLIRKLYYNYMLIMDRCNLPPKKKIIVLLWFIFHFRQ